MDKYFLHTTVLLLIFCPKFKMLTANEISAKVFFSSKKSNVEILPTFYLKYQNSFVKKPVLLLSNFHSQQPQVTFASGFVGSCFTALS